MSGRVGPSKSDDAVGVAESKPEALDPKSLLDLPGLTFPALARFIERLATGPATTRDLVGVCGVPLRIVEQALRRIAADLVADGADAWRLASDQIDRYRAGLPTSVQSDPAGHVDPVRLELIMEAIQRRRPDADRQLDHVGATARTLADRVSFLDTEHDLGRERILCLGDHDLTSLAVRHGVPGAEVSVFDLDDRLLDFIDRESPADGRSIATRPITTRPITTRPITTRWWDFRYNLPPSQRGRYDVVVTDPPYTPEGVSTFLIAALQALRDRDNGRIWLAYGFGRHTPALGHAVQQAILDLGLAISAMLPGFNAYHGALAIGSRSDLYVLQATAQTWRLLDAAADRVPTAIYTHGRQSVESSTAWDTTTGSAADLLVSDRPAERGQAQHAAASIRSVLTKGVVRAGRRPPRTVAIDAVELTSPVLLRLLLAITAERVEFRTTAAGWAELSEVADLLAPKWALDHAREGGAILVTAIRSESDDFVAALARRATGTLANSWREAAITQAARAGRTMTKNEARAELAEALGPDAGLAADPMVTLSLAGVRRVWAVARAYEAGRLTEPTA